MNLLRRDFSGQSELIEYLAQEFPNISGPREAGCMQGGRTAALERLDTIQPGVYARTRNHLDGAVTKLSPYLRHGVLSLREVAEKALSVSHPGEAIKLLQELAWRDYFQRVYRLLGDEIWLEVEDSKCGWELEDYQDELPEDIIEGQTGLNCMDQFIDTLIHSGYLHNHARMWLASYVVHFRRISWQSGARWFLSHLLDGDEASNALSWQWISSHFASKPYLFNRTNLEMHHCESPCVNCQKRESCPFDAPVEELARRLFPLPVQNSAP